MNRVYKLIQSQCEAGWETRAPDTSKKLIAHAEFAKTDPVTKHLRKSTLLLA